MADMVQKFSAVTLSNKILNHEIYMTAAIVTKMNEGSRLIIIQKFIIFLKSFNLHREHRNIVNHLGSRLISSGCSIHRLRRALYREPLLLPEETNRTQSPLLRTSSSSGRDESHAQEKRDLFFTGIWVTLSK